MDISINSERLKSDLMELAQIGRDPNGGISRPSFSKADLQAREWLKTRIKDAGLEVRQDGAGNIFGRLEGESRGKTIMAGSHIDTVLNGGDYDGSLGVIAALECLRRIKEEGVKLTKSLEIASFTDEEGNLVGDFLGSRAFIGCLNCELLEKGITQFGAPLSEILMGTDFTIDSIMNAHKDRPELEAFLEIHIEQGPVLELEEKNIGIVDKIAGKNYWMCAFTGEAGHAGTTPIEFRHDAFLGLADFSLKGTHYVATKHYGSMITIGKIHLHPGAFSIIPERAEFTLDFRSSSANSLQEMEKTLPQIANDIASTRGLQFNFKMIDKTVPVEIPRPLLDILESGCKKLNYSYMFLPSGAGHDAQILSEVTDSAMIFIPCVDGISHSPQEKV
ncbi:MAG: M20 family metallo-hydrolase, partial [Candidatus Aminicenantes bacterium]|nr:M20 family metallo-hydrolase [Candidatus Aminicenantes bacterium]